MTHSFHRGSLALDFVGTVGWRPSATPEERLPDPPALRAWLVQAGLLPGRGAVDEALYDDAVALREAIARAGFAVAGGLLPAGSDVRTINDAAGWTRLGAPRLDPKELVERRASDAPARDALGRIAADAIHLLAAERARLTTCDLSECGALLLSRSRGETRRWCSMETCGNRAKVAAYRRRNARA